MRKISKSKLRDHRSFFGAVIFAWPLLCALGCGNHRPSVDSNGLATCVDNLSPDAGPATCVNLGLPDPGPKPATLTSKYCNEAESGLEFLPLPIWDFALAGKHADELSLSAPSVSNRYADPVGTAVAMYVYDDLTSPFRMPYQGWELPTQLVNRCGTVSPDRPFYALHLQGGPYMEWGGGMGRSFKCMNTDNVPAVDTSIVDPNGFPKGEDFPYLRSLNLNRFLCSARTETRAVCRPGQADSALQDVCPQRDKDYAATLTTLDEPFMVGMALDVSDHVNADSSGNQVQVRGWDGIAFWARRSPNSQVGLRVAVADKYIDDDMSYLSYKYDPTRPRHCERNISCNCANHKPCTDVIVMDNQLDSDGNRIQLDNDGKVAVGANGESLLDMSGDNVLDAQGIPLKYPNGTTPARRGSGQAYVQAPRTQGFCFDPAVDPVPPPGTAYSDVNSRVYQDPDAGVATFGYGYTHCGPANCNTEYPSIQAVDPQAHGRPCTPFAFRGGTVGSYCFEPAADPNPSEGEGLCGDFWMKGVNLSTDWQLIKVPFASLLQQGWAKRSYQLDLSSITSVRLEWDRGWIDYWISDVRFYRTKAQ